MWTAVLDHRLVHGKEALRLLSGLSLGSKSTAALVLLALHHLLDRLSSTNANTTHANNIPNNIAKNAKNPVDQHQDQLLQPQHDGHNHVTDTNIQNMTDDTTDETEDAVALLRSLALRLDEANVDFGRKLAHRMLCDASIDKLHVLLVLLTRSNNSNDILTNSQVNHNKRCLETDLVLLSVLKSAFLQTADVRERIWQKHAFVLSWLNTLLAFHLNHSPAASINAILPPVLACWQDLLLGASIENLVERHDIILTLFRLLFVDGDLLRSFADPILRLLSLYFWFLDSTGVAMLTSTSNNNFFNAHIGNNDNNIDNRNSVDMDNVDDNSNLNDNNNNDNMLFCVPNVPLRPCDAQVALLCLPRIIRAVSLLIDAINKEPPETLEPLLNPLMTLLQYLVTTNLLAHLPAFLKLDLAAVLNPLASVVPHHPVHPVLNSYAVRIRFFLSNTIARISVMAVYASSIVDRKERVPRMMRMCKQCKKAEPVFGTFLMCAGCRRVRYCSKACQVKDWRHHRMQCSFFRPRPGFRSRGVQTSRTAQTQTVYSSQDGPMSSPTSTLESMSVSQESRMDIVSVEDNVVHLAQVAFAAPRNGRRSVETQTGESYPPSATMLESRVEMAIGRVRDGATQTFT